MTNAAPENSPPSAISVPEIGRPSMSIWFMRCHSVRHQRPKMWNRRKFRSQAIAAT